MKMTRFLYHIAFCIIFLAATSCEVEFDLKGLDTDPIFILDGNITATGSNPGEGHLSMFLYAAPSAAGDRHFSEEARCTLKIYKNGEHLDTKDYITIESFYGLIADNYPDVRPGDAITLTAESEGFPTASVTTIIPPAPPAVDVYCERSGGNVNIRFSFEDDGTSSDAYAFNFQTLASDHKPSEDDYGTSIELPFWDPSGSSVTDFGPFDIVWEDGIQYYGLFDDDFNGGKKEIGVSLPGDIISDMGTTYFRIEVQRISPERLHYQIACHDKGSDILGFIGLAPVSFAYTNVRGGTGCISGINSAYTEWVEIPGSE